MNSRKANMHISSVFNAEYFTSQLEDAGALKKNTLSNTDQKTLVKVKSLTVGLVLAAKAVDIFSNSDIVKWIRKDRKLTPLLIGQFLKYNELADYLMNEIEEEDVNIWKNILSTTLYTWPSSKNDNDWANVFGDKVPELCKKIDNDLRNKVISPLNNSANSITRVSQDDSFPKENTKKDKSEDVKLKSENRMKTQVKDHVKKSPNTKTVENEFEEDSILEKGNEMAKTKNVKLKLDSEKKQIRDDAESKISKNNFMNENLLKESEVELKNQSDRSSLDGDDQLDFLFNDEEELDYEYDAVNTHDSKECNKNTSGIKLSEINEEEELDYEYDINNSHDIEESNENYGLKESENNKNEISSSKNANESAKVSEDHPQNSKNTSYNEAESDDGNDFDESNFGDFLVLDAEGDSDENEFDTRDDEGNEESSRDWRFKGRSSNDKDKSKSLPKCRESKNTINDKINERSKSLKEKLPDRFEKIVIITDKLYKDCVSSLINRKKDQIVLIADEELTIKSLPGILDLNRHKGEKNSLWIIVTGMYSLIEIKDIKRLNKNYIPHVDNTELKKFSVSALIKEGREMRRIIKSCLSESCAVVSCPPIPAALLVNQKGPMKEMSYDIGRFNKEWTRMAREFFEKHKLEYNNRLFRNYVDMNNVGGIHQIRYGRNDECKKTFPWKMLLSWYEIVESIRMFNVIRKTESSQSISSKSVSLKSHSQTPDNKRTSRLESASEEKSNSLTTIKKQDNSPEKRVHTEKDPVKEEKEFNESVDDKLELRETLEPSDDLLVVVIGEEKVARDFCKINIPNIRFKIVIVRKSFDYSHMNQLIPGNHLKSENMLWIVLCDLSRLYDHKFSYCNRFDMDCKERIDFACQLQSHELSRKCRKMADFADEIRKNLGKDSYVFLAPVIPQSVLHCPLNYKSLKFHSNVHRINRLKSFPIFQPFAVTDEGSITKNYNLFEKEWLKAMDNIMTKQKLNFELILNYEKKKGKVVEVFRDPWEFIHYTKSYKEWEIFMEALIVSFRISIFNGDSLTKENKNMKSEKINKEEIKEKNEIEAETQNDKESSDSNDIVANQVSIENIPNDLKSEDFERVLGMCGEFSDIKYKNTEKLFLFREALVTFMNANSVLHAIRLLNGKEILKGKLSVKEINKEESSYENCDEIDLMLVNYDEEFVKKAAESINGILTNLGIGIIKELSNDKNEKSENRHKDSKGERQHGKLQDSNKGKENEKCKSSNASVNYLKRKAEERIETKVGDGSKSSKSIRDSQSSEKRRKSSKDSIETHRAKSSDTLKRIRNMENRKSRSCSPIRKKSRTDDRLKDNEIEFINVNNNNKIDRLMAHFLAQFGGSRIRLSKSDEHMRFRFKNKNVANLLSTLLCNLRFPDKHLQVLVNRDSKTEDDNADLQFIAMHLDLVLKRIPHFASYLDDAHSLWPGAFNLFTFKTKKCLKTHPVYKPLQRKLCVNFHGFTDSRRDPREYDYDSETCPKSWNSKDAKKLMCPNGNKCRFSHTMLERVFHMSTLKKNVCMDWYQTQSCDADRNCAAAHPETPEVLFHDVWRDVYLSGLEKTYQYLVGAVQNLRHVLLSSQYGSGMQVLVVSPSIYVIEWLAAAIKKLAEDHKLRVATALNQDWKTGLNDIVIATPEGAVELLNFQNDASKNLKGIIIDDCGQLLKMHKLQLDSIAQTLINQRGPGNEDIQLNRVVVSETIYQDEVDNMANILQTEFTVLGTAVNGSPPQLSIDKETDFDQIVTSGKPLRVEDLGVRNKMKELGFLIPDEKRRTSPDPRIDVQTDERSAHKRQQHRKSPSSGSQRVNSPRERWRHSESSGHREARSPRTRRSRSPRNNWTRSPSPRDNRKYRGDFRRSERSIDDRFLSERGLLRDSRSSSGHRDSQFKSFSPRSSRNWSPDNQKSHSGNSIYENIPHGGPPDYNNVSRNGGDGSGQDNISGGGGGGHLNLHVGGTFSSEPAASSPWSSGSTHPSCAIDDRRGGASAEVPACERSSISTTTIHSHNRDFTISDSRLETYPSPYVCPIYDTCSMLNRLLITICDDLGIIGISFRATLQRAMQYHTNRKRMTEIFREPDVKSLMEVVVRKITELVNQSFGTEQLGFKVFLNQMTRLIEQSKGVSQQINASMKNNFLSQPLEASTKNNLYGIDMESIAKETLGKDNPFVISDIQNRLLAAQGRVDSDKFSKIFKAVSMLQFDMMIKNSNVGGSISTHTDAVKRESPERNSVLFNQDLSFNDNRRDQNRQGYIESNRGSGNKWLDEKLGYVESDRESKGNIQQHSGIFMNRGRMEKYDPMEAGIEVDYREERDCSWNENRVIRNKRVSPLGAQGANNSSIDVWNQGLKGMEQILGSSLIKEGSLQNSADFSAVNMQNRTSLQGLKREPVRNSDLVGTSGFNRWEQGHGKWEHAQGHERGSAGSLMQPPVPQYGSPCDDILRQPTNFNKSQGPQHATGLDMWSNPVRKSVMDRHVVDYDHHGSDRKVLDYCHQKESSGNSTFEDLDNSENAMDSRNRPRPVSQQSFSAAMSNNIPFLTTQLAPHGTHHGAPPQYDAEENNPRIAPTGHRLEDHIGSGFANQLEHGFSDPPQQGSRFEDIADSRFGNQQSARFDEQRQLGPRFGSIVRQPGPREF